MMTIYDIAKYLFQLNELLYRIINNECTHTGIGFSGYLQRVHKKLFTKYFHSVEPKTFNSLPYSLYS